MIKVEMATSKAWWMLPVAAIAVGLFLEDIVDAVEAKHYPHLAPARSVGLPALIWDGAKFMLLLVAVNLLALIVYVLSTILAPIVFFIANGYLFGRQYFEMIAYRRLPMAEARRLRRRNRAGAWGHGIVLAVALSIPILNIFAPIIAVAAFTHLYHRSTG